MELEDITIELHELQCLPEIRYNYDAGLNDYLTQYEDFDLIMRISGLQVSVNQPAQPAGISSRSLDMEINHTNYLDYPRNQPAIQTADFRLEEAYDHDQRAATESSLKTFLHRSFDHVNANDPAESFAAAGKSGAMHDQPVASGKLVYLQNFASDRSRDYDQKAAAGFGLLHLQSSANDHSQNDHETPVLARRLMYLQTTANSDYHDYGPDYPAGLMLEAANNGAAAASLQRCADHYEDGGGDDQHAGVSSEDEAISSSKEEEEKKKRTSAGTLSGSSCKPLHNERDSRFKPHTGPHSVMIKKRAAPFIPPPQYRRPIIIHTYSPKIIHTSPSKFMWLVQSLTGSSETRSRCLKNPPDADHHKHLLHGVSSAASMEAQYARVLPSAAHAHTYHDDKPAPMQANSIEEAFYHHFKSDTSPASPLNSHATSPNYSLNRTRNAVSTPNYSPNTNSNVINTSCRITNHNISQSYTSTSGPLMLSSHNLSPNHIELCNSNSEQSSSSTISCSSKKEVSPRGPFCTWECEGVAHAKPFISRATIVTPPAPIFEGWPLHQLNSNMEGSVHSSNFFESTPCNLSNPNNFVYP